MDSAESGQNDQRVATRRESTDAQSETREFLHTTCHHRADGSYVVERRGADSSGHRKVFESQRAMDALLERLPREFTAEDLTTSGLSGGRRHMVLRHLVEHPRWPCTLVSRQPLTALQTPQAEGVEDGLPAD